MGILKKPLITEKFSQISEKLNQFAFIVEKTATKPEIISEIEKVYSVIVTGRRSKNDCTNIGTTVLRRGW